MLAISQYVVFFILVGVGNAQRTYDLVLEKFDRIMVNKDCVDAGTVRVSRINRTHNVVTGDFELFEKVDEDLKATIQIYEKLGGEYKRSSALALQDKPVCDFLKSDAKGFVEFKESTNLPKEGCPVPPGNYSIYNFYLDSNRFPAHLPGKKWRADLYLFKEDVMWAHYQVYVRIDRLAPKNMFG